MEQSGDKARQNARAKGDQHGKPDVHAGHHAHNTDRAAKAQRSVHRQVGHIQNAEGNVNADGHNGPDQALRQRARHSVHQCCDIHGETSLLK